MAVINLIGKTMGGKDKRSKVTKIARHHSATTVGDVFSFENYWKNTHKWNTGGYHEIILRNGDVQVCYADNVVSNGVYSHNTTTYHICMVGNGSFTDEQEKTFDERAKLAMKRFGLSASDVLGHNEFSGANTGCPGVDMGKVRSRLKGDTAPVKKPVVSKPAVTKPVSNPKASLAVDGYVGKQTISALQRYFKTPVDGKLSRPSMVIKALQKLLGVKQDGYTGPITIRSMQRRFGTVVDGKLSRPSLVIRELQRRLNKGKL